MNPINSITDRPPIVTTEEGGFLYWMFRIIRMEDCQSDRML